MSTDQIALIIVRTLVTAGGGIEVREAPLSAIEGTHRHELGLTIDAGAGTNDLFAPDTFTTLQGIANAIHDHAPVIYNLVASLEQDGCKLIFGWRARDNVTFIE